MTTLAAVLVRQRTAPLETVEQAMLRQSLFGGDLATNLLELQSIEEPLLLDAIGMALECPPVSPGPLGQIPAQLRSVVRREVLVELICVPLGFEHDAVVVAIANPPQANALQELSRLFGRPIALRAALEPRIRQSLALNYGADLDHRTVKLLAKLDGVPIESIAPPNPFPDEGPSSQVPTPRVSLPPHRQSKSPNSLVPSKTRQGRRLGPFTVAMAEAELSAAATPAAIISIWLDFASQYFDYTAVFAVQGDLAAGKVARGSGTTGEPFSRIGVPLDLPNVLEKARKSTSWLLAALAPRGLDRSLARDLGRNPGPQVFVLPTTLRGRVVLLTYGDHGSEDVELNQVGDVLAMRPLVERHFERLMFERKRGRSLQPPQAGASISPSAGHRAINTELAPSAAAPSETAEGLVGAADDAVKLALSNDLPTAPSHLPVASDFFRVDTADPHHGETLRAPVDTSTSPEASHRNADTATLDDSWDLVQPVLSVGELPRDMRTPSSPAPAQPPSSPPAVSWSNSSTRPGLAPKLELVAETESEVTNSLPTPTDANDEGSLLPSSRADSHPALALQPPSQSLEQALPSVVVDYDRDCLELIDRLSKGETSALEQLVAMGDTAIGVLVRALPGPIASPSRTPRSDQLVKASECGPILRALIAFGPAARPFVIARSSDGDPQVRVWAIRLLGELGGRPSAMAVAERITLDREPEVRRAAHQSSQMLYRDPDSAQALRQALLETAASRQSVITQRLAAIDALSDLRDVQAIPQLIDLLSDSNPGTAASARQALIVLARQDFGYDATNWSTWWQQNGGRDRIDWMIDALDHRQPAIRQAAAEELRLMSRLYVGDFDDESTEAREKVQKKYRDWWAAGGRSASGAPKQP